jgi:hypothetical protein
MENIITKKTTKNLIEKGCTPFSNGSHLRIYKDELKDDIWQSYCEILGADIESDSIIMVVVAMKEVNWSTNNDDSSINSDT